MMDSNKVKLYDGKSDVTVFLTRVNLVAGIITVRKKHNFSPVRCFHRHLMCT